MELIINGKVQNGQFPSEPELCVQIGVSRVTLRAALKRLEQEGLITRSHYYGTRLSDKTYQNKKLLIACSGSSDKYDKHLFEYKTLKQTCLENKIEYDECDLHFLQDAQKIAERYFGIIFFGANILGTEPFFDVIKKSKLPAVYCREDENNIITRDYPSVGVSIKKAWYYGFDHLVALGFRNIASLFLVNSHNGTKFGFLPEEFSEKLRREGYPEAAELVMVFERDHFEEELRTLIIEKKVDALYCTSDHVAAQCYKVVKDMGFRIPRDIVILGFGMGSDLMTPSLSSVKISSEVFGKAVIQLLHNKKAHEFPPLQVDLPTGISEGESVQNIKIDGLCTAIWKNKGICHALEKN